MGKYRDEGNIKEILQGQRKIKDPKLEGCRGWTTTGWGNEIACLGISEKRNDDE